MCGLTTAEVAHSFLVTEATMAARITRAKKKIAAARIPYRVPSAAELPERVVAVLDVVHLLFTTGHTAPAGDGLVRADLIERALHLARTLRALLPQDRDVAGLLALMLLTDARRDTRVDAAGRLVLLADQDRSAVAPGRDRRGHRTGAARRCAGARRAGTRCRRPSRPSTPSSPSWDETDWDELTGLYDRLLEVWPSPVVALNRAVTIGLACGPQAGLDALEPLAAEPQLAGYGYLAASRADFLRRLGRTAEARGAYEEALLLADNTVERQFLERRLAELA